VEWRLIKKTPLYQGFFHLAAYDLSHALFAGGTSPVLRRELLDRGNAVAVLPYDPEKDSVVLIEQFRIGAKDDTSGPWLMEIIAGYQEEGEDEEDVAIREAREEAGCEIRQLIPMHRYYSTPGSSNEQIHLYLALVDATNVSGIHGLEAEGEDIRAHVVDLEKALEMLDRGEIDSAMPIIALQWLALHKEKIHHHWKNNNGQ